MLSDDNLLKVFLAEDEVIVREALRDSIPWEQHGFVFVGEASDGEMALEMVRELKPDIVITDIKMPFMNGLTFSKYVSEELPDTKIIIISGYDDFEYARQAVELHVDRFLLKPVTKADMISALENTRRRIEEERARIAFRRQSTPDTPDMLELSGFDPMVLGNFIETGRAEDIDAFVERFFQSLHGAEQSVLFKNYLLVSIRIRVANALQDAGITGEKLAELVDDLRGGERTDTEVGQPDMLAALREAHVQLSFVFLHIWIERIDDPCALHVVATRKFTLIDFHNGEMVAVFR